ncbi:MAG TPA: glycoside hydrolase family 15 protein [Frankiaceae bacterium]|jgi:GH15 family glucan-1,4-alpha-glucosidase|nr:glycoside hydrolase family 15 protein [Frankiaceae bacterium]
MSRGSAGDGYAPLAAVDGYLPIEDHGLLGDGTTAALVARDATVAWLCVPRFDSAPVFCSILDAERGGAFRIAARGLVEARQRYEPDTAVLVTELRTGTGAVRVTDCLALRPDADLSVAEDASRGALVRSVLALDGEVELDVAVEPRGGATAERSGAALVLRPRDHDVVLTLSATVPLDGPRTTLRLAAGERVDLVLCWSGERDAAGSAGGLLDATLGAWRRWSGQVTYEGPRAGLVRRSALTLKALDYLPTGGLVAAPTSSLPEAIGGVRNWDYRFAWVRDAAFAVYALRRVDLHEDASGFLRWVLAAVDRDGGPRTLYTLDGDEPPPERTDASLPGYRGSAPVRWGNAASHQRQHDAYGEILDCAWQGASAGGSVDALWPRLVTLVDEALAVWRQPDHGIWEVRTSRRPFTYSAAMCQVALDRGARMAEARGDRERAATWAAAAEGVRAAILEEAWDPRRASLTENLGGGGLDASLLALPLRRVVDPRHPRMVATVDAVRRELDAGGGLLYRYLAHETPDGLPGGEGAFLLCSFWLVDNLAYQGRLDEARALYDSLCDRAGPLGLLPEEVDPSTGAFLGNYPQAFSHVGVISSGVNLARLGA